MSIIPAVVTIPKEYYFDLLDKARMLRALTMAGIEDTEQFHYAKELYAELLKQSEDGV